MKVTLWLGFFCSCFACCWPELPDSAGVSCTLSLALLVFVTLLSATFLCLYIHYSLACCLPPQLPVYQLPSFLPQPQSRPSVIHTLPPQCGHSVPGFSSQQSSRGATRVTDPSLLGFSVEDQVAQRLCTYGLTRVSSNTADNNVLMSGLIYCKGYVWTTNKIKQCTN